MSIYQDLMFFIEITVSYITLKQIFLWFNFQSQSFQKSIKKQKYGWVRSFEFISNFQAKSQKIVESDFSLQSFDEKNQFLVSLCPLTLKFYLRLGAEVDFGLGIEKPVDRKQLSKFLMNCKDSASVLNWVSTGFQPIAVSLAFSHLKRTKVSVFIFFVDLKHRISLRNRVFEEFGAPVDQACVQALRRVNKGDEVYCFLELDEKNVRRVSMQLHAAEVSSEVVEMTDSQFNFSKWSSFKNWAPGKFLAIEFRGIFYEKYIDFVEFFNDMFN